MNNKRVAVIGGGPAGMMAAYQAAKNGHDVTLFEKNEKLGKKLFLTGKGRCNITNDADIADFFTSIVTNEKFLYSALYSFTNNQLIEFLNNYGLKTKTERGGRVFPFSDKSSDVIKTLEKAIKDVGVQIQLNTEILEVGKKNSVFHLKTKAKEKHFDAVIIASGGLSYPSTGSDGKTFEIIKKMGHRTTDFEPSLVSLVTPVSEDWPAGLTLKNIGVQFHNDKKVIYTDFGELLFTHWGISGPVVLSASAFYKGKSMKNAYVLIDFKPALDEKTLDERILREIAKNPNKALNNLLRGLLPLSMISPFITCLSVDEGISGNAVTKENRREIVELLKKYKIEISGKRSIKEAIITRGGVKTSEINPSTMESKIITGLYFAGEMIDVDAQTGGYNLQIAFSTGSLAGSSI